MSIERKLASIQEIKDIQPIDNADAIVVATVLGWKVVLQKADNLKIGDKVVYCEIDSRMPKIDVFSFLETCNYRIKTQKYRGQVSQGIVFPLNILPEGHYELGDDVTAILNIEKYEIPMPLCIGDKEGPFPGFLEKTDETRIQTLGDILPKYNGTTFYKTEKVDGCSITAFYNNEDFGICTRNFRMKKTTNSAAWNLLKALGVPENIKKLNRNIAIQGELIGWNIQKNKYKLKTNEFRFYLFNVFDINTYQPVPLLEMLEIAKKLNLNTVPILDTNYVLQFDVDALVEQSKGQSLICPTTKREGFVYKSVKYISDPVLGRLSFKIINPDFLIKYKE